jgi:glycosyltransferase involved in cell wall biosynthesis/SAM-dependent methyltransferase
MTKLTDADHRYLEELNQPAERGGRHGVTRYLFDVYRRRPDLQAAWPDLDGEDGERLVEWAHVHGRQEVPIIDELLPAPPRVFRHHLPPGLQHPPLRPPPLGVNVMGPLRSEVGLGEASRLIVKALDAVDVPTLPAEGVLRPPSRRGHDFARGAAGAASFPISVLCTNPTGYFGLLDELGEEWFRSRVSIGFWWWEAQGAFPLEWRAAEKHLSEVWTASEYVAEALRPFVSVPVVPMRLAVAVDEPATVSRAELGLPDGFLFLFVFDYYSTAKRKNPFAVVEAFRRAFPPGSGASLVVKCNNPRADSSAHRDLLAAAAAHPDVRVVAEYLAPERKDALIAACDCYVSLHRAEGFGLTGAEAMYLGKPVIATGFSGNLDYMTPANSYLVDWTPARVGDGAYPYPPEGTWAEPDVAHAAALMREVFDDPQAAAAQGRRGAQDIRRTHSPAVAGAAMEERLRALAPRATRLGRSGATAASHRVAALLEAGPAPPPRSPLGPIGRLARRVVLRLIRPYTEYERMVNEELLAGLREAEAAADRTAGFELQVAHARAEALAGTRRNGRVRAASNGHYPSLDVEAHRRLQAEIDAIPYWWHCIDLGDGVVTPGAKYGDLAGMRAEWDGLALSDLRGATVLDVGAWDGFYSFEAERRGAARVVALDHFVWSIDPAAAVADGRFTGVPDAESAPGVWDPERLPGKRGFDLAHRALGSRVESVVVDFMTADVDELGSFDIVLFLGVLYHMRDPLGALRRLRALTGGVAVIESEAIVVPGQEDRAVCEFLSGDQLNADPTNWWVPNLRALHDMCEAAGFGRTETVRGPPPAPPADGIEPETEPGHYRAIVHAFP